MNDSCQTACEHVCQSTCESNSECATYPTPPENDEVLNRVRMQLFFEIGKLVPSVRLDEVKVTLDVSQQCYSAKFRNAETYLLNSNATFTDAAKTLTESQFV